MQNHQCEVQENGSNLRRPIQNKVIRTSNIDVSVIPPSEIIKRELANPIVARHLQIGPATLSIEDENAERRNFTDSAYYADYAQVLCPSIFFGIRKKKVYIGEAVLDVKDRIYIIIDISNEDPINPCDVTIRAMRAFKGSDLPIKQQAVANSLIKNMGSHLELGKVLVIAPMTANESIWKPTNYKCIHRSKLKGKFMFEWETDLDCQPIHPVPCLQISGPDRDIEPINKAPFLNNYRRWRPFDMEHGDGILHFQLYVDGFRTWLSRSGNVTAIYLALSQLPVEELNGRKIFTLWP